MQLEPISSANQKSTMPTTAAEVVAATAAASIATAAADNDHDHDHDHATSDGEAPAPSDKKNKKKKKKARGSSHVAVQAGVDAAYEMKRVSGYDGGIGAFATRNIHKGEVPPPLQPGKIRVPARLLIIFHE